MRTELFMSPTSAPQVLQPETFKRLTHSVGEGIAVEFTRSAREIEFVFSAEGGPFASARVPFGEPIHSFAITEHRDGFAVRVTLPRLARGGKLRQWAMRLI